MTSELTVYIYWETSSTPVFLNWGTTRRPGKSTASSRPGGWITAWKAFTYLNWSDQVWTGRLRPRILQSLSAWRAIPQGSSMDSKSKWARIATGRRSMNRSLKKKPGREEDQHLVHFNNGKLFRDWYLWKLLRECIWIRRLLKAL